MRMVGRITYSYACSVTRMNSTYSVSSTSSSFHRCHGQKQSNIKMIHVFKLYFFLIIFYHFVISFLYPYERCLYWSKEIEPQRWNDSPAFSHWCVHIRKHTGIFEWNSCKCTSHHWDEKRRKDDKSVTDPR